ncbi:entericidin EcnAB [Vibrio sp. vnigr-6D03]|nr:MULTISPECIES: entericidin EcnAB [Vibrio]PKF79692.1 entericidin EcnAB [Vibrio sp. vnigr-6D03]
MRMSFLIVAMSFVLGGCAKTWEGVKDDSSEIWKETKETIHEATE